MKGVSARLEGEAEGQISQAWHTAAFNAATKSKPGLKPLRQLLKKPVPAQTPEDMLALIRQLGAKSNMKIRKRGE